MNFICFLQDGNTALLKACRSQRWNIAKMLISCPDISIDICDNSGTTPLFVCVSENCYEIAELLLKKGAELNGMRVSFTVIIFYVMYYYFRQNADFITRNDDWVC